MHLGFLQSIRETPADNVPRLIYADWLQEQGDDDRGEFIRVQCQLSDQSLPRQQAVALLRRLRDLSVRHRRRWLGPLARYAPESFFERGFVERINLSLEAFLDHADEIMTAHPIHIARFRDVSAELLARLAQSPHLGSLDVLELHDHELGAHGTIELAQSPYTGRILDLNLNRTECEDEGLIALVQSGGFVNLRHLYLATNGIGDRGVSALARSATVTQLETLNLRENDVGSEGAAALALSESLRQLKSLDLAYNRLSLEGARLIVLSDRLESLKSVNLFRNRFSSTQAGKAGLFSRPGVNVIV